MIDLRSMSIQQQAGVRELVERAWSIDTTSCPDDYAGKDLAYGQCGVTAVFLHIQFGADLWAGDVDGVRHYWASLGGWLLDYTWRQFPAGARLMSATRSSPAEIVRDGWMEGRCRLFAERVRAQ